MKKLIVVSVTALGTAALAHSGVKNTDVMNRMIGMTELSKQMKLIGDMAKEQTPFDAAAANAALDLMTEEASYIPSLFEIEALDPKSEALPHIWTDFDDFTARANALEQVTAELSGTVTEMNSLRVAVGRVGKACSACHETYRK